MPRSKISRIHYQKDQECSRERREEKEEERRGEGRGDIIALNRRIPRFELQPGRIDSVGNFILIGYFADLEPKMAGDRLVSLRELIIGLNHCNPTPSSPSSSLASPSESPSSPAQFLTFCSRTSHRASSVTCLIGAKSCWVKRGEIGEERERRK